MSDEHAAATLVAKEPATRVRKLLPYLAAVVISVIVLPALAAGTGPTEPAYLYRAEVVRVVDGDTIDVDIDLGFYIWTKKQRIRLVGIDAPEPRGATKEAGLAATEYLRKRVDGKTIIVQTVKGKDGADRKGSFGRWLGVVYVDGVNLNEDMIERGFAVPYEER